MYERIAGLVSSGISTVKNRITTMQGPITGIIIGYMAVIILLVLSYYFAWAYNCYKGNIVLADLLAIIREVIGTSMVACITFIAGCFVDLDRDGIPDKFQNKKE